MRCTGNTQAVSLLPTCHVIYYYSFKTSGDTGTGYNHRVALTFVHPNSVIRLLGVLYKCIVCVCVCVYKYTYIFSTPNVSSPDFASGLAPCLRLSHLIPRRAGIDGTLGIDTLKTSLASLDSFSSPETSKSSPPPCSPCAPKTSRRTLWIVSF